jgi:hypothetical protein
LNHAAKHPPDPLRRRARRHCALLFIYVEAMSAWKITSEAKKVAVEADILSANRELMIENKASEMREKLIRPDPFKATPAPADTIDACDQHDADCRHARIEALLAKARRKD